MNKKEIKIAIGLVVVALLVWFGWKAIQPKTASEAAVVAASGGASAPDEESSLLKEFSIQQLIQASNLFKAAFDQTLDLEGEPANIAGCTFSHEEAERYMNGLRALLDDAKVTERQKYMANPQDYEKAHEFARCEEHCTCGGYAALLAPDANSPAAPETAGQVETLVAELNARAAKQAPEAVFVCAGQQDWFCKSRLHHYLENELAGH
jgi:N-acetylglutamate synthase-like GNAT family acetyltransferase